MMNVLYSKDYELKEIPDLVLDIDDIIKQYPIWLLEGDLGAGKTTFVKALVDHLGITDPVSSPTFSIIQTYENDHLTVYHMDLYRLRSIEEAQDIGVFEYFEKNALCIVEWPELIQSHLPSDVCLHFKFEHLHAYDRRLTLYTTE